MTSKSIFPKVFMITAIATMGFLALSSYASKKALKDDPELLNRLQSKYNVRISGFGVTSAAEITNDRWSFSGPFQKIKIATVNADIRLMPSDDDTLIIEASGRLPREARTEDRILKIKSDDGDLRISDGQDVTDISILIKVPKNTANLSVNTVNGDVSIKYLTVKEFSFNLVTADLQAENVNFGHTEGVTISGDVEISTAEPAAMKLESISGDVKVKLLAAQKTKFALKTIAGEIENSHASVEGSPELSINTTSGDIKIE